MFSHHLPVMLLVVCLAGCGSSLRVTSIQLGRSVNADSTIANHTTRFAPDDTIYVSVLTAGVGSGEIGVRWVYRGRVIDEPKKQVSYRDVAATQFNLRSGGAFPVGDYTVEVSLDGQPAGSREFKVENPR